MFQFKREDQGYVVFYENGMVGLDAFKDRALQNKPFDVILSWMSLGLSVKMKVLMPLMDRMEAAQCIQAYEMQYDLSPTPIIVLASHTTIGYWELCHQAGMGAYIICTVAVFLDLNGDDRGRHCALERQDVNELQAPQIMLVLVRDLNVTCTNHLPTIHRD
ncbi:hypothetical protein DFH07DRAFT_763830 [Mycena maculata]|uniref:Uncharacterized protein n=1 Tax=Mycena maculata TaxID=230809 RepID=A0AAD7KGY7_9AGAR|nr:hypothetical protein DFH07DRAFT_763830 [Mycena maculata]